MLPHQHNTPTDAPATTAEGADTHLSHHAGMHARAEHTPGLRSNAGQTPDDPHGMSMHTHERNRGAARGTRPSESMAHDMSDPAMAASMEADIRKRFWVAFVLSIAIVALSPMAAMFGIHIPLAPPTRSWTLFTLTTPVVFWCGWMFVSGAYQALRARKLDMSVLIAVGVLAAYLASFYLTLIGSQDLFYEAAAMLVTFVLFGHWMEMKSRRGTSNALRALFDLVPAKARVLRDGKEVEIPTSEVVQGDFLILRPSDRVAVDGAVTEGETYVDEALVTGESVPVQKKPGDKLIGGSVNGTGAVTYKATDVGEDATLSRIARLVETAQNSKAPGQRLADKAAGLSGHSGSKRGNYHLRGLALGRGRFVSDRAHLRYLRRCHRLSGCTWSGDPDRRRRGNRD